MSVADAARRLGISEGGVRKRAQRGQIPHERDERGRLWVWLDPSETHRDWSRDRPDASLGQSRDELVAELRDRVAFLQRELERKDAIMLNMTEAMKALNPPRAEPPESAQPRSDRDAPAESSEGPQTPLERPWWRRVFGG